MRIFVAGATGVLGRRAVRLLVEDGHEVTGIARSEAKAALLTSLGATPARVDLFDAAAITEATTGFDVVLNLATHIPPPSRYALPGAWKENDRIRGGASVILADAALSNGAQRFVQESIAFVYEDRGTDWIDEDVPLELLANVDSVATAEAQAARVTATGADGVVLRFALFYGHDATHTVTQIEAGRKGVSAFLGEPSGYMSSIHLDDAATAVVAAVDVPSGTYNVADDEPMQRSEADAALADALGRKRLRRVPSPLLKVGGKKAGVLTRSQRVSNARLKAASGWTPTYPSLREGLPQVVAAMRETTSVG